MPLELLDSAEPSSLAVSPSTNPAALLLQQVRRRLPSLSNTVLGDFMARMRYLSSGGLLLSLFTGTISCWLIV